MLHHADALPLAVERAVEPPCDGRHCDQSKTAVMSPNSISPQSRSNSMESQHDRRDGRAQYHVTPLQDESAGRAETDGGSRRKPILVRIFLAWEAAHRRRTDEFIQRHKNFNSFY